MNFICYNGSFFPYHQTVLPVQNRAFKYGDGVFETMRFIDGGLPLGALHFERLFTSLGLLKIGSDSISPDILEEKIYQLVEQNDVADSSRIRLTVYRNDFNAAEYVIEALPLEVGWFDEQRSGLAIDIFPDVRKACDAYANLKSTSYLPYVLAGLFAKDKGIDDCLVLNRFNHVADSSKANIFLVKDEELYTPALHQGCVKGVMRSFLIDLLKKNNYVVHQVQVTEQHLLDASEVFLTNALYPVQSVSRFRNKEYLNTITSRIIKIVSSSLTAE